MLLRMVTQSIGQPCARGRPADRQARFEMTEQTREAVDSYIGSANKKPGEFLFGGQRAIVHRAQHMVDCSAVF